MPPAYQRLDAVNEAGLGVDLRLIVQLELLERERLVQVALQLHPLLGRGIHAFRVALNVVPAALLGAVHGGVGVGDERLRALAVGRKHGDADARGGVQVDAVETDRELERLDGAPRDVLRVLVLRQAVHDEQKLVPAEAPHRVGAARDARQAVRHFLDERIPGAVSQRVVDDLEAVEIEHGDPEAVSVLLGVGHRLRQAIVQQHAVRQAGEGVVAREVTELLIGGLQSLGAGLHDALQMLDLTAQRPLVVPLARQRVGTLQHLDGLERLLDDQQLVGMVETRDHLGPVVIGVRRADDDLHVRIELPQAENRLQAVPAGRHAHVDERHRVGALLLERPPDPRHALLPLERGVDLECRARDAWGRFTEQQPLGRQELRAALGIAAEDLAEVLVDGRVVVDDEHPAADMQGVASHVRSRVAQGAARRRKWRRNPSPGSRRAARRPSPWRRARRCAARSRARSSWW